MNIANGKSTPFPILPFWKGVFTIYSNEPLSDHEAELMMVVLSAIQKQCEKEGILSSDIPRCNMILSGDGSFEFIANSEMDAQTLGYCMNIIIYSLKHIRERMNDYLTMVAFCEEICHIIWNTLSETETKHKIIDILNLMLNNSLTVDNLQQWGVPIE